MFKTFNVDRLTLPNGRLLPKPGQVPPPIRWMEAYFRGPKGLIGALEWECTQQTRQVAAECPAEDRYTIPAYVGLLADPKDIVRVCAGNGWTKVGQNGRLDPDLQKGHEDYHPAHIQTAREKARDRGYGYVECILRRDWIPKAVVLRADCNPQTAGKVRDWAASRGIPVLVYRAMDAHAAYAHAADAPDSSPRRRGKSAARRAARRAKLFVRDGHPVDKNGAKFLGSGRTASLHDELLHLQIDLGWGLSFRHSVYWSSLEIWKFSVRRTLFKPFVKGGL